MPKDKEHMRHRGALFIPAGLLIGMGFGFLFNQLTAGLFLGLGIGFLVFAVLRLDKDNR